MKKEITQFAAFAVAMVIGAGQLGAQDSRERRQEVERKLRELRTEMQQLERQLDRNMLDGFVFSTNYPRVVSLSTSRVQLGVLVQTDADRDTDEVGALLEHVTPGSPADEAGLMAGDIITSFNGRSLLGPSRNARPDESAPAMTLIDMVRDMNEGDDVEIEYQRDGSSNNTTATLRQLQSGSNAFTVSTRWQGNNNPFTVDAAPQIRIRGVASPNVEMLTGGNNFLTTFFSGVWSDMELVGLNEDLGQYFGTSEGLLVIQAPDTEGTDLRGGDVILTIDGRTPRSPSRAIRILRSYEAGEEMSVDLMRNQRRITVSITVPENEQPVGTLRRRNFR